MPHSLIELHDSRVAAISKIGEQVIVFFAPAYIHASEGRPGWDPGRGYVQAAALTFAEGSVESDAVELTGDVWEGNLEVDGHGFKNVIPIPFDHTGAVTLRLHISDPSGEIMIRGKKATLILIGDAVYVEEFSGADSEPPAAAHGMEAGASSSRSQEPSPAFYH